MRLGLVADVHGNLPALEAVVADLAAQRADAVVNLGDCASGPLWPRETLGRLRALGWPTVRGNHDRWVGCDAPATLSRTDRFTHADLADADRLWLARRPATLDLSGGALALHGRPGDDNGYLLEDMVDGRLSPARNAVVAARLAGVTARLILCAHSHLPAVRRLADGRWIVNPGSVGCAYDDPEPPAHLSESGSPSARYAIVEADADDPDRLRAALFAIPYDHTAAARRAEALGRPDWAAILRTGRVGEGA